MLAIEIKIGEKSNQFSFGIKGRGRWITRGGPIDLIDCEQSLIFLLSHRKSRARVRCERNEDWSPSVENLSSFLLLICIISEERRTTALAVGEQALPGTVPPALPTAPPSGHWTKKWICSTLLLANCKYVKTEEYICGKDSKSAICIPKTRGCK